DSIFTIAETRAANARMAYVNTDIIFLPDFMNAMALLGCKKDNPFFAVGRRWHLPVTEDIDFRNSKWDRNLLKQIDEKGYLQVSNAIDYFLFQKGTLGTIKPFALGRTIWDNWMIKHALEMKLPVVDSSQMITAIHQNHDYRHLKGGKKEAWNGIEARQNLDLAGGHGNIKKIAHAQWVLTRHGLQPNICNSEELHPQHTESGSVVRNPKFSIVMIVLNGMPFIEAALKSIYGAAHEIIIVEGAVEKCMFSANSDGSSTDG
ncbi:MAG: hypothetical protein GY874_06235, partial [Desulfobacteraceae bacterium]|nr:hypothetical protein [Desulfobacteraceae bacterium]